MNGTILVTGGAGFIGSNFVLEWLANEADSVINLDLLTYAGNPQNLSTIWHDKRHQFVHGDITDQPLVEELLLKYKPRAIVHFAAESHVDRSISGPNAFVQTNVIGTFSLLEAVRHYWSTLPIKERGAFRFLHVSTDEVYGTLAPTDLPFTEDTPYAPNSPYAASKAGSDHLVRAYYQTYSLPTLITHCSNNYGPYQFPEKLIPLMILNALQKKPLPVYGDGQQIRDWLYVTDHCTALRCVLANGEQGQTYNIGGGNEKTNIDVVNTICSILDELHPIDQPYAKLVEHVTDRPGHDRRYAISAQKINNTLNWVPLEQFETGLRKTVAWYLANLDWVEYIQHKNSHNSSGTQFETEAA